MTEFSLLPSGKLVIHNKSIGGGRGNTVSKRLKSKRTIRARPIKDHNKFLEEISEVSG